MSTVVSLGVMQSLIAQLAAFQAALLLASGLHKWIARGRTRTVLTEFAGVPRRLAPFAAAAVASAEALAGVLLWVPSWRAAGAVLAALLWGGYLSLILHAIARGRRDVDCGCSFGAAQRPLGAYQVLRNAVLTGSALLVAAACEAGAVQPFLPSQVLAGLAFLALYGALDQTMSLTAPRSGELL